MRKHKKIRKSETQVFDRCIDFWPKSNTKNRMYGSSDYGFPTYIYTFGALRHIYVSNSACYAYFTLDLNSPRVGIICSFVFEQVLCRQNKLSDDLKGNNN